MIKWKNFIGGFLAGAIILAHATPVYADYEWPQGPEVNAVSAVVMDAYTGTILYEKNKDEVSYPASITKILTTLLAVENCSLDETVIFSEDAVYKNEGDTSHISRDIKEEMTMEECLYATMLASANECAYAVGEHVADGNIDAFIKMMNDKATSLGCKNTHFSNPNGLPDETHVTTAYDMALISREAYLNETFRIITATKSYTIPPTNKHDEETYLHNHHKMLYPYRGDQKYLYDYCVGGKTGYTIAANSTLVTFLEKGDMALVVVVMNVDSPNQYVDTKNLAEYCFDNFQMVKVTDVIPEAIENESQIGSIINHVDDFAAIEEDAMMILPKGASYEDAKSEIIYDNQDDDILGTIQYTYGDIVVGHADVRMTGVKIEDQLFDTGSNKTIIPSETKVEEPEETKPKVEKIQIKLDWKIIAMIFGGLIVGIALIFFIRWISEHFYIVRQKLAYMRNRKNERMRYKTIRDTRKSRRKRRNHSSKNLRF